MTSASTGSPDQPRVDRLARLDLESVRSAAERIRGHVLRTPLVPLNLDGNGPAIYLKLENLQPTGSFKVRGALNAVAQHDRAGLGRGVFTCSAGNMAQALAWVARSRGIPCTVLMPESAPKTKVEGVRRLGAEIIQLSWDAVWNVGITRSYPPLADWTFIHPFADPAMMAGNGTIGLEILDDLATVEAIAIPLGGGGLACGIATAVRSLRPEVRVYGCEPETAAPFAASFALGTPQSVARRPTFVDGAGAANVLPEMWERAHGLLAGSVVVSLSATAEAIRTMAERKRIIAEGAAGMTLAAARSGQIVADRIVCVVSGGNIDTRVLSQILTGSTPD